MSYVYMYFGRKRVYAYMCTCIGYIHTYIHTYTHTYTCMHMRTCMPACMQPAGQAGRQTVVQTHVHTYVHATKQVKIGQAQVEYVGNGGGRKQNRLTKPGD